MLSVTFATVLTGVAGASTGPAPFPRANLTLTGHGLGSGYGLGQWGAFGLATVDHFTYRQILAHYYSDAAHPVTDATLSRKSDGEVVSVAIQENDGRAVTVTSPAAFTYVDGAGKTVASIPAGQAGRAFEIRRDGSLTGLWEVETAPSCSASRWTEIAMDLTDPTAVPASLSATAPASDLLTLCRADHRSVTYRGSLEAYDYYGAETGDRHLERTLNLVGLEDFVADVTPTESPAGWGSYGGTANSPQGEPWGFQELEAQAIAVRSYLLYSIADGGWNRYADICDDACEYYAGVEFEAPIATLAADDTAGRYLVQNGGPAPTEYGPSDGGHTAALDYGNGQSIFDATNDPGDSVCIGGQRSLGCNPWHTWAVTIPVTTVERQFSSLGTLVSVKITATDSSGRAVTVEIIGEKASVAVSAAAFAGKFPKAGFHSSLFVVTDGPGATQPPAPAALAASAVGGGSPGFRPPVGLFTTRMLAGGRH